MTGRRRLPRAARLADRASYDRVFRDGRFLHGTRLVLGVRATGAPLTRCGIILPRKRCPLPVHRNRTRRLLRELFRLVRPALQPGYDLVALPRAARGTGDYAAWAEEWQTLLRRAGIWRGDAA